VSYQLLREELDNGKTVISPVWPLDDGTFSAERPFVVTRTGDGCVSIEIGKKFLYPQEMELLSSALEIFVMERKAASAKYKALYRKCCKHNGPRVAICAECGEEIGGYESRRYGEDGAVHVFRGASLAKCLTSENADKYPLYYTDG
jgi:hypothetical protein